LNHEWAQKNTNKINRGFHRDIQEIIPHKSFGMRIQNYIAIDTDGEKGLDAALKSPLFNELYGIFKDFSQKNFARLVNSILDVKSKINKR